MMKYRAITFKEKQEALELIFDKYHKAKMRLDFLMQKNFYPSLQFDVVKEKGKTYHTSSMVEMLDNYIDTKTELETLIWTMDSIIVNLSKESKRIIVNEFLNPKRKDWWMDYYSRSTYYRFKARAMEEMLFYLHV